MTVLIYKLSTFEQLCSSNGKIIVYVYMSFQEYEVKSNTYRSTLNDDDEDDEDDDDDGNEPVPNKFLSSTMAQAVQRKVQLYQ